MSEREELTDDERDELIDQARHDAEQDEQEQPVESDVLDLMAALKASLGMKPRKGRHHDR